ncbi:MAG: tyrosine-type recombinase/integrase [Paraclostridium sp.]
MNNNCIIKSSFIRKRGNNFNVYIEYINEFGELKQKSLAKYKNKKDAEKHLIDLKSSINNNKFIVSKDITFVNRCINYMNDESKGFSPTTIVSRKSVINTSIIPFFKDTKLKDVTPTLLQGFANYVYKNHTQASAKHRLGFVKAVLNEAYRLREITSNPVRYIKVPKSKVEDKQVADSYTREEVKLIVSKLEDAHIELPILLMLTLGLRAAEVSGLTWKDINFKNNTISISKILVYVNGTGLIFKEPKTEGSVRTISAPSELMVKLKKWKIQHNKYRLENIFEDEFEDVVCLNLELKPYLHRTLIRSWYRFLDKNNIRRIRLHDLRHTHATMLVLSGTDMKTISDRLGHTDIKITMNKYSHVLEEMDKKASENISNIMFK